MDLKTFVSKAISDIVSGLAEAEKQTDRKITVWPAAPGQNPTISFDVAVTVSYEGTGEAGAKIEVLGIPLAGASVEGSLGKVTTSRIQFNVHLSD